MRPSKAAGAKGHPELLRDYGYRALHLSTLNAKGVGEPRCINSPFNMPTSRHVPTAVARR